MEKNNGIDIFQNTSGNLEILNDFNSVNITSSGNISASNINVGTPSNPWGSGLEGSFFNTFDANTNISEILDTQQL